MSQDPFTFYSYIMNSHTDNTELYKTHLNNTIDKLPNHVCSSKYIYELLKQDLDTYYKSSIFRNTFMEYFKLKIQNL